jgi:hypothetical protein
MAIPGIVETVANSVAICELVLMGMIVADRRSARTPILARNSVFAGNPALTAEPWLASHAQDLASGINTMGAPTVYSRFAEIIALRLASKCFTGQALSQAH